MSESMITKRALADAMRQLMTELPFNKITVGDICTRCGMSRKGFYYHFRDKYDLVNWIFYTDFIADLRPEAFHDSWAFLESICSYFYDNRLFYIHAFQIEGQNSFTEYFTEILQPIIIDYMEKTFAEDESHVFYATFFTDAFRIAIIRWLKEETQIDPQEFMALLRRAASGIAKKCTPAVTAEKRFPTV